MGEDGGLGLALASPMRRSRRATFARWVLEEEAHLIGFEDLGSGPYPQLSIRATKKERNNDDAHDRNT